MRRIGLAVVVAVSLILGSQPSEAQQQTGKVPRVGFLAAPTRSSRTPQLDAFQQGMRELGWVDGKNVVIESRWADSRADRLSALAAELVRLKVDVIFAASTAVAVAARNATHTIPIVAPTMSNPVELGLVASIAHPGGNVTGLSYSADLEIFSKQLELLKETVPRVRSVAILSNPTNPAQAGTTRSLKVAARSLGVQLRFLDARGPKEFDDAFAAMTKEQAGALLVLSDPTFDLHGARL